MEKTVIYNYSKSTKTTYVFVNPEIGTLYLPQSLFSAQPQQITVTIKA